MSFKLGTFDTDDMVGLKAILQEWPMLPVEVAFEDLPSGDGSLYYRSQMKMTEWKFDLEVTGTSVTDVMAKADLISLALNPKLGGLQTFIPNAAGAGWSWQGLLSEPISWKRDKVVWFSDRTCRLSGVATISTPNPYGISAGAPVLLAAPGTLHLTGGGNTSFRPYLEFRGALTSAQWLLLGGTMQVAGPLLSTETIVLDFNTLDFYIKTTLSGVKTRNIGDRITNIKIFEGVGTLDILASVSGGTFTQLAGTVLSRRI